MKRISFFALFLLITIASHSQNGLFIGGGLSLISPSNGFDKDHFGFNDVANTGGGISINTLWFFNPLLSLGSELGYAYLPKDKDTWNQSRRGNIKVNYKMTKLTAQGNFYFNDEKIRPYMGVAFGLYYLRNTVDFDSNYTGSINDASVSYTSNTLHAGFGPEAGILFNLIGEQFATLSIRYTIIPNIEAEYFPEDDVTINPHGQQNHWSLSAKLYFRAR
ncbi:porin family protein [Saccharicrinis fermentans]|uniref:hypothetical protein n=1 Tax=Saccharicrinis fermentans TaxID=982 RepID=UPI000481E0A8|nr:hypothetical protein [Saccharicrinis fermentans]